MSLSVQVRTRLSPAFELEVAFAAAPGVTIVFCESGSGKSTLLRTVAGLTRPDSGRVACGDRVLFDSASRIDMPPAQRRVGFVFQHLALFPHLSAAKNIEYGLADRSPNERRQRVESIAASFRIDHVLDRRPGQISGGERQRVGLARSLVTDPDVLLLDEPFSALDALTREAFDAQLEALWLARCRTVVVVTHSVSEAVRLGDRVWVMTPRPGRLAADISVPLPRPRGAATASDPAAAAHEARVRDVLASVHAPELTGWAESSAVVAA